MATSKSRSKATQSQVGEGIRQLQEQLVQGLPQPEELGQALVRQYPPAGRTDVLSGAVKGMRQGWPDLSDDRLQIFLLEISTNVPAASAPALYTALLEFAHRSRNGSHGPVSIGLARRLLFGEPKPLEGRPALTEVQLQILSRNVEGMDGLLASVLLCQKAENRMPEAFLVRWSAALLPLIGFRARGGGISPRNAATILDALADVPLQQLPDVLLISFPRLTSLAEPEAGSRFLQKPLGAQVVGLWNPTPPVSGSASSGPTQIEPVGFIPASEVTSSSSDFLAGLSDVQPAGRSLLRAVLDHIIRTEETHNELQDALSRAAREQQLLSKEKSGLQAELVAARQACESAISQLAACQEEIPMQEAARQGKQRLEHSGMRENLRKSLSRPARNTRDHLKGILDENPEDRKLRRLALAFDQLHQGVLKCTGEPESERLPESLRAVPEAGDEANAG